MSIFEQEIQDSLLVHVPHNKFHSPLGVQEAYPSLDSYKEDWNLSLDWGARHIFDIEKPMVEPALSRLFCDVERFPVDIMDKVGRGFFYTKDHTGADLKRTDRDSCKEYYDSYHKNFTEKVDSILEKTGMVIIIDGHTFNDIPLAFELDQITPRPDICIGVDEFHTQQFFTEYVFTFLSGKGFEVRINTPYKGTMVPLKFYQKDERVHSIMIEVNKRLFMDKDSVPLMERLAFLNNIMKEMFSNLR